MSPSPIKCLLAAVSLTLLLPSAAEAAKKRTQRTPAAASQAARITHPSPYWPAAPGSHTVVLGDRVLGSDPDPRIRHELLRDLGAVFGGPD